MESTSMTPPAPRKRTLVLGAVICLLALPVLGALVGAAHFNLANRDSGVLVSSSEEREYLLYIPRTYDREKPTPLVMSLHGGGLWPAAQQDISQWNRVADEHGFLVVYPAGTGLARHRAWRAGGGIGSDKEVRYISDLIDTLKASYNIDSRRIYANGLSNGAGMSFVLSCALSDRIAAVGLVGAAHMFDWNQCTDARPMPMISFHGTADPATPYHGGQTWVAPNVFPSIPRWTAGWGRRNQCDATPVESPVAPEVIRIDYKNCTGTADVVLYRIEGGGHSWPGGGPLPEWFVGPTTRSIDASREMWAFFREHPAPK
jgi:polyhydroxybutyrate depolymerase